MIRHQFYPTCTCNTRQNTLHTDLEISKYTGNIFFLGGGVWRGRHRSDEPKHGFGKKHAHGLRGELCKYVSLATHFIFLGGVTYFLHLPSDTCYPTPVLSGMYLQHLGGVTYCLHLPSDTRYSYICSCSARDVQFAPASPHKGSLHDLPILW